MAETTEKMIVDRYAAVPKELKDLPIWMLWLSENGTKVPYRTGGSRGSSTDPAAWTSFDLAAKQEHLYTGMALALVDPYCGIDLDGCLDADGSLKDWAQPIVQQLDGVAYAEVSPSGTGLKLITRARKPEGSRCVAKMGQGKCQVEIYDHARFWAMTGNVWDNQHNIGEGQQQLSSICQQLWPAEKSQPKQEPVLGLSAGSGGSLLDRATSYVAHCDNVVEGGRQTAAFQLSGHLWVMVGDMGERLTMAEVSQLVSEWNAGNSPPLPEEELERAIRNGKDRGTPPSDKSSARVVPDYQHVDISGIVASTAEKPAAQRWKPEPFPMDVAEAPGLIGELVEHNLQTAMYPLPELALAGALALMSTVTGQRIADPGKARPNLYLIGLAPSGGGKDWARVLNAEILQASGAANMAGPERIGSHAGIITQMEAEPVTLFQIDEIGHMVAAMQQRTAPHLFQISSVLMQL